MGAFEDRLHTLLLPIVEKAIASFHPYLATITEDDPLTQTGRQNPALIMINSAFWDTARWVREDMRFGRDLDAGLNS
ncbi:hypothetical protein QFC22_001183 [Naganishia vaughanmartiniae]|uniref:Uncharacterized protein n=1 Tax=Naganishia vaughanmartiniae TaxID=1424756 RepID=A0ACC2XL85_9TREE|nr:hypothetical protein QFC22_001183 [Naganishia vaughanmartiniae]